MSTAVKTRADTCVYTPLDACGYPDAIRLLSIRRARDGTIEGWLTQYSLSKPPKYTALSYAWGSEHKSKEIRINHVSFRIRDNLWQALSAILAVSNNEQGNIWIDSICIDQSNTVERNHQVRHMWMIYSLAEFVISWLGPPTPDTDQLLDELADSSGTAADLGEPALVHAARDVLSRSYWRRLWVVQEVMLARHVRVMCGTRAVPYQSLISLAERELPIAQSCGKLIYEENTALRKTPGFIMLRGKLAREMDMHTYNALNTRQGHGSRLGELFDLFHDRECLNPYDKIYGLLGMVTPTGPPDNITIDYAKPKAELCWEVLEVVWDSPHLRGYSARRGFTMRLMRALQMFGPGELRAEWSGPDYGRERVNKYLQDLEKDDRCC
jgi:hypothetical protein